MIEKIKQLLAYSNEKGISIPLLRDPKTGTGSITFTMLFLSFNIVLLGLIGKAGKLLDVDLNQAIYFFLTCSGLYLGRTLSTTSSSGNAELKNDSK